ncbi:hypothetical protein ND748_32165, partial [Frankia sp. AiPs1]|uniref:hypothetical protein n=1 Tax=Frankia sp. AiPs1 TaxID=573493 RepID=UPI0035ABE26B|nr:hypothetical protein [Frankia sp. AiPs1]
MTDMTSRADDPPAPGPDDVTTGADLRIALAQELADLTIDDAVARLPTGTATVTALRERARAIDPGPVVAAARRILDDVQRAARPQPADLDRLGAFVEELDALCAGVVEHTGEPPDEVSRDAVIVAVDRFAERADAVRRTTALQRLAVVDGPPGVTALLGEVRTAAAAALRGGLAGSSVDDSLVLGLLTLVEIIDEAADEATADDVRLMELDDRARSQLPTAIQPVLVPAGRGRLRLPEPAAAGAPPAPLPPRSVRPA